MNKMNVIDTQNVSYIIGERLGEGSQGTIYLLEDKKHIVKLYNNVPHTTATKSKISFLMNLDLDKRKFAIPLRQIVQPRLGYIAGFASGMKPLSELKPKNSIPDMDTWYKDTGGLPERYQILTELAALLTTIHGKGLAYCDLSPKNVFVSAIPDKRAVFLIDLDNLRYDVKNIANNIFTPFYGAPEVVTGNAPNTTFSDCFSFAVLAYELLTFSHPLLGDYVSNGEPDLEDKALAGNLPWVEDSHDTSNSRTTGLPSDMIISQKLFTLFRKTFEKGLKAPIERPSMGEWLEALIATRNELLRCGNDDCGNVYPYNNRQCCTFCGYSPKRVFRIKIRRWEPVDFYDPTTNQLKTEPRLAPAVFEEMLIDERTEQTIEVSRILLTDKNSDHKALIIKYFLWKNSKGSMDEWIKLTPQEGLEYMISPITGQTPNKSPYTFNKEQHILLDNEKQSGNLQFMIHFKDLSQPQRVITIE